MGTCGAVAELEHNQGAFTPQSSTQKTRETSLNVEGTVMADISASQEAVEVASCKRRMLTLHKASLPQEAKHKN